MQIKKIKDIEVLLFDIGGVLVELGGVEQMMGWTKGKYDISGLWKAWGASHAVHKFETGQCGTKEFINAFLKEWDMQITPEQFLAGFTCWPKRKFEGVDSLILALGSQYRLACFSNNNEVHWPRTRDGLGIGKLFGECYLSHKIGLHKPSAESFEYVAGQLGVEPARVVYLDDSTANVNGALNAGFRAFKTQGMGQVVDRLRALGVVGILGN